LHYAAMKGHASTCRVLINEGASITAMDRKRKTPLKLARAKGGSAECVSILEAAEEASEATEATASSPKKK